MVQAKPAGIVHDWSVNRTPESIEKATDELIERTEAAYRKIAALKPEEVNFDNVIKAILDTGLKLRTDEKVLNFFMNCATEKSIRDASLEADKRIQELHVNLGTDKDVYDKVVLYKEKFGFDDLKPELKRYAEKLLVNGRRNGLHLEEEKRKEVKELQKKIAEAEVSFSSNLNEDTSHLYFSREELAGVPEDLVNSFEKRKEDGKLKVTMKSPHYLPVMRKCRVPETRRKVNEAYVSRCMDANTKLLEELITLRDKQSRLLGYKNHAAYVQEERMAKNPETVAKFLSELTVKLQPIWKKEKAEMLKLKEEECKKYGYEFNGEWNVWDGHYYTTQIEEKKYSVDNEKLKEYFPLDKVTKGMFEIYQELLGLTFDLIPNADAWHKDVSLYRVDDAKTKTTLGYFFLDLHPRDGKYGHAAIFPLQPPFEEAEGKRQLAVCAMMANFSSPTEEKPSLLDHQEATTYFHEFGHIMHMICNNAETAMTVEWDFIEAPSQMLENWCWKEEPLRRMSGHFKDGSPIPDELLQKLIASRIANAGGFNLGQLIYATFDQRIHTRSEANTADLFRETVKEIKGDDTIPNTNTPATIGHMVNYDAQYYGYLWSEVYSFDMFETRFEKEGLMSPAVGAEYRKLILEPGGSKDAIDMIKAFLGREPNQDAFLRSKGLAV